MRFNRDRQSEHAALFLAIRDVVLSFDGVQEKRKPQLTSYHNAGGGLCYMRAEKLGIRMGFFKGAHMDDIFGLLRGEQKHMRHLFLDSLQEDVLFYYMLQAMEQNKGR